jgi:large subunit ribosomal protein L10
MSKYVKNLLTEHLREQLQGVDYALVVNLVGMDATHDNRLRKELRSKNIHVVVVKNSLAQRAASGTRLAPAFEGASGSTAICWGGEDVVSLAKEVVKLARNPRFAPFAPCGGVMDGERLTAVQVEQVSRWPSRREQLSLLAGQILGPGARLGSQLIAVGGALASQIAQKAEGSDESDAPSEAPSDAPVDAPSDAPSAAPSAAPSEAPGG